MLGGEEKFRSRINRDGPEYQLLGIGQAVMVRVPVPAFGK